MTLQLPSFGLRVEFRDPFPLLVSNLDLELMLGPLKPPLELGESHRSELVCLGRDGCITPTGLGQECLAMSTLNTPGAAANTVPRGHSGCGEERIPPQVGSQSKQGNQDAEHKSCANPPSNRGCLVRQTRW